MGARRGMVLLLMLCLIGCGDEDEGTRTTPVDASMDASVAPDASIEAAEPITDAARSARRVRIGLATSPAFDPETGEEEPFEATMAEVDALGVGFPDRPRAAGGAAARLGGGFELLGTRPSTRRWGR